MVISWVPIEYSLDVDVETLASACLRRSSTSRSRRREQAASRRSGVGRLMTPMVKWIAPTGRTAFGGRLVMVASLAVVTSVVKREMEA